MTLIEFDADRRSRESVITIAARKFRPRKMTGDVFERLVAAEEAVPEPAKDAPAAEVNNHNMRLINVQIAALIVDADTSKAPTEKFLAENLGLEEGVELLRLLVPGAPDGGAEGNADRAEPSTA